jgi:hypothetical protein
MKKCLWSKPKRNIVENVDVQSKVFDWFETRDCKDIS